MTSDLKDKIEAILMSHPKWMSVKYAYNTEDEIVIKLSELFEAELAQAVKDKDRSVLITLLMSFIKMDDYKDPIFMYLKDGKTYQCKVKKFLAKLAQSEEEK